MRERDTPASMSPTLPSRFPPNVVWLSVGNAGTDAIATLLERRRTDLETFDASAEESLLVVELNKTP